MALFLSEQDVAQVITMPMALAAVEDAHRELAMGQGLDTPRMRTRLPQTALHLLQGALPAQGVVGYKAYTSNRSGNRFLLHLFDAASGQYLAIIEANRLGMMRTGAASGIAAKYLARPESKIAGVFGAGWQAEGHVQALCAALALDEVRVFARKPERLSAFCAQMSVQTGVTITPVESPWQAVDNCDVVGTVTTASSPLFEAEWVAPGTHINAAGSNALIRNELSEAMVKRCDRVVVDTVATALSEAGDLLPLLEKGRLHSRQLLELGDIIVGRQMGRSRPEEITLFESQGLAIQDIALGLSVLKAARDKGLGQQIPLA